MSCVPLSENSALFSRCFIPEQATYPHRPNSNPDATCSGGPLPKTLFPRGFFSFVPFCARPPPSCFFHSPSKSLPFPLSPRPALPCSLVVTVRDFQVVPFVFATLSSFPRSSVIPIVAQEITPLLAPPSPPKGFPQSFPSPI